MWDDFPATCWLMHCSMHRPMQGPTLWRMPWLGSDSLSLPISSSLFTFYVCIFASVFLLTGKFISIWCWCYLAAWLCEPLWLFQALSTQLFTFNTFIVVNFILSLGDYRQRSIDWKIDQNEILSGTYKKTTTTIIFILYYIHTYIHTYAHAALLAATFLAAMATKK